MPVLVPASHIRSRRVVPSALAPLLVGVAVLLGGCSTGDGASSPATSTPGSTGLDVSAVTSSRLTPPTVPSTVYVNDPNAPVEVVEGQVFGIRLEATDDGRSGWDLVAADDTLLFPIGTESGVGPDGRPTETMLFRALRTGTTELVLRFGDLTGPSSTDRTVAFAVVIAPLG